MTFTDLMTLRELIAFAAVIWFIYWVIRRIFPHRNPGEEINPIECIFHGATLIADGFEYFPDWSASMLREFDESIKPELEHYYQIARSVAGQPQEKWSSIIRKELDASEADRPEE